MNDEYFVNHLRPEFYYIKISQYDNDNLLNYPFFILFYFKYMNFEILLK